MMEGGFKSLATNCYARIFANDSFFAAAYPMDKKSISGQVLREFIADFGVKHLLVCDLSKEQIAKGADFMK